MAVPRIDKFKPFARSPALGFIHQGDDQFFADGISVTGQCFDR